MLFVQVFACLDADILFQVEQLYLTVQHLQQLKQTVFDGGTCQQVYLVIHFQRQVGTDKVQGNGVVSDVLQGKLRLIGYILVLLDVFYRQLTHIGHRCRKLAVFSVGQHFDIILCCAHEERAFLVNRHQATAS